MIEIKQMSAMEKQKEEISARSVLPKLAIIILPIFLIIITAVLLIGFCKPNIILVLFLFFGI